MPIYPCVKSLHFITHLEAPDPETAEALAAQLWDEWGTRESLLNPWIHQEAQDTLSVRVRRRTGPRPQRVRQRMHCTRCYRTLYAGEYTVVRSGDGRFPYCRDTAACDAALAAAEAERAARRRELQEEWPQGVLHDDDTR